MLQVAVTRARRRPWRLVAKDAERTATKTLRGAAGARRIAAQESLDAARVGAEAAEVEPVAGRLPRNHELAGKDFRGSCCRRSIARRACGSRTLATRTSSLTR
jgi:hypothetical protein